MISISITIKAHIDKVWEYWTHPIHITNWYFASDEWHAPFAENKLEINGSFKIRMEAKDGSFGFDFEGKYLDIKDKSRIEYILSDNRKVITTFLTSNDTVIVEQQFDPESQNDLELQKNGWQAILNNFKRYTEKLH